MLLALSTGHKLGLGLTALLFIVFALASSFLLPRYRPDYPGRGLKWFALASSLLFVAMLGAVEVFGREPAEAGPAQETTTGAGTTTAASAKKIAVTEKEFKIELPSTSLAPGTYELDLKNAGKVPHDLTVAGPGVDKAHTPTIGGGATATLKVTLQAGEYDFYCSVPGHKQLGMDVKVKVA